MTLLVSKGADLAVRDSLSRTPLHEACKAGHVGVARHLLNSGADMDAITGGSRSTPLHWAARGGHLGVVSLLLARGAGFNARNNIGLYAIDLALLGEHVEVHHVLRRFQHSLAED